MSICQTEVDSFCVAEDKEQFIPCLVIKKCLPLQHQSSKEGLASCLWLCLTAITRAQRSNRRSIHSTNPCIAPLWLEHLLFSTLATDLTICVKDRNSLTQKVSFGIKSSGFFSESHCFWQDTGQVKNEGVCHIVVPVWSLGFCVSASRVQRFVASFLYNHCI